MFGLPPISGLLAKFLGMIADGQGHLVRALMPDDRGTQWAYPDRTAQHSAGVARLLAIGHDPDARFHRLAAFRASRQIHGIEPTHLAAVPADDDPSAFGTSRICQPAQIHA